MRTWAVILLAILGALECAPMARAGGSTDSQPQWKLHDDKEHGFQIKYPAAWESKPSGKDEVVALFSLPPVKDGHAGDGVAVLFKKYSGKVDLDVLLKSLEEAKAGLKDAVVVGTGSVKLAGLEGRTIRVRGKDDSGVDHDSTTVFTATEDGRFYSISFGTDPERYEDLADTVKKVFASFKITAVGGN